VDWQQGAELMVSGTASVVGHETRHAGNATDQLNETFLNLASLLDTAGPGFEPESLKAYVRNVADAPTLRAGIAQRHPNTVLTVLHGDICRQDLAIEIEGVYTAFAQR
jgi:chorismate lyase/3-hydroxybenzoate synthase